MNTYSSLPDTPLIKISGPSASGKTEALMQHTVKLIQSGIRPDQIMLESPSSFAAYELSWRLSSLVPDKTPITILPWYNASHPCDASAITIGTPTSIAQYVIERHAHGKNETAQRPLMHNEIAFITEDLLTTGIKPRRIRAMLERLKNMWSYGLTAQEAQLNPEEIDLLSLLQDHLAQLGVYFPEQASNIALEYLDKKQSPILEWSYILCDDFELLSKSQQTLMCRLAQKQLIVTGEPQATPAKNSWRYAHTAGFDAFEQKRSNVHCITYANSSAHPTALRFAHALSSASHLHSSSQSALISEAVLHPSPRAASDDEPSTHNPSSLLKKPDQTYIQAKDVPLLVKWTNPTEELTGMAEFIAEKERFALSCNPLNATYIVVPNKLWAHNIYLQLASKGIECDPASTLFSITEDPRKLEACKTYRALLLLMLSANPEDMMAWRCWCGLGDYLLGATAWHNAIRYARSHHISLREAILEVPLHISHAYLCSEQIAQAVSQAYHEIDALLPLRGFSLLQALGSPHHPLFTKAQSQMQGDETVTELWETVKDLLAQPHFSPSTATIRIAFLEHIRGLRARNVYILGAIDGFFPQRDAFELVSTDTNRQKHLDDCRYHIIQGSLRAQENLILSAFESADLELAEQTKMQVSRVRSIHEVRCAVVRPSCFVRLAGQARPFSRSGQELLARL